MERVHQLLDYLETQEDAILTYQASNMVLVVHSDASYLRKREARSRAGGHFPLSRDNPNSPNNGAILTVAQIIKAVMSLAEEAELVALYINSKEAIHIIHILTVLGRSHLDSTPS